MNELYNLDCVEFMDTCISQGRRFDCCITSPPYNMMLRVRDGIYIYHEVKIHTNFLINMRIIVMISRWINILNF